MHIASGLQLPSSFDGRLVRSFIHAICMDTNHLAIAAVAPGSGGTKATPGATNRNGESPKTLWDVFSLTDFIQSCNVDALLKVVAAIQNSLDATSFGSNKSHDDFLRAVATTYKNTQVSELGQLEAVASHLAALTDALCASGTVEPEDLNKLDDDEAVLQRMKKDAGSFQSSSSCLDTVKNDVEQALKDITERKLRCTKSRRLQQAFMLVDVPAVVERVKQLREEVEVLPLQAVRHAQ
ncbi:hypothetical protein F5883DRAFT_564854 [Diaporthe sp. PMI_573]|nr:hypothetical protein F5883DRAFT_564854 [Diaporthaceae sp. PMI_573]